MSEEATPTPSHVLKPHARPMQPMPVQKDGKQFVALRDPSMLIQQTMVVQPQALPVIQLFEGELDTTAIAERLVAAETPDRAAVVKEARSQVEALATQMDQFGLLWGPKHEEYEQKLSETLHERGMLPLQASGSLVQLAAQARGDEKPPEDETAQREWGRSLAVGMLETWMEQAEDPEFEAPVIGLVVPHLDYVRGAEVYAGGYRAWVGAAKPDRVVILGTNHFGAGDGVVMTELGHDTPLGPVSPDREVLAKLRERLGDRLFKDELDLVPEHSIEFHLPFITHLFGDVPVVAALIPDPLVPMIEDDGKRVSTPEFVEGLGAVLEEVGGLTYFVASADLSHVGPQFGEPKPVDDDRRVEVERHDREHLGKFLDSDAQGFLEAMEWCKNQTRWCSVGNMYAVKSLANASAVELIDYKQASDERGHHMVSVASMAFLGS
ncbi:MAG: AmmeMemoRadiSam system protein B [Planctomycetaceae bacterium]|nr:AmmeMemoRadiSam system protein B [Planctomycetaceae bacterium]